MKIFMISGSKSHENGSGPSLDFKKYTAEAVMTLMEKIDGE